MFTPSILYANPAGKTTLALFSPFVGDGVNYFYHTTILVLSTDYTFGQDFSVVFLRNT